MNTLPNFLIIGAMKAGTSSLYHYLKQHPQIYMCPTKEVNFFAFEGAPVDFKGPGEEYINRRSITELQEYKAMFRGVTNEKAVGEVSHEYMFGERAAERIRSYIPDARLITILRNPAERAFSEYIFNRRDHREPIGEFAEALAEEAQRVKDNWNAGRYLARGFYYGQLKRYYDLFDREQIRVYLYEDLRFGADALLDDIYGFLEVDRSYQVDKSTAYNVSGLPKNKLLHTAVRTMMKANQHPVAQRFLKPVATDGTVRRILDVYHRNLVKPELSQEMRQQLIDVYRDDILKLQNLLQRDLSGWLKV